MLEPGDLLLAEGGASGDRAMESAVQHGAAAFVAGLQATGTGSHLAEAPGAWRGGKRYAFPTSPHPRRRLRTKVQRRYTNIPLGTKDRSGHSSGPAARSPGKKDLPTRKWLILTFKDL